MQEKRFLLRFLAVPLRQKLVAAGIAVAVGSGFFILSRYGAKQPATMAVLSFDADAARQIQPTILYANDPAAALAKSILSDDVTKVLAKQTGVKGGATEFRSHLKMVQPADNVLRVRYQDADPKISAAAANLVAIALVAWTPALNVSNPLEAEDVPAAAAVAEPHRHRRSVHAKGDALRVLEAQLAATDRKLSALNAGEPPAGTAQKTDAVATPAAENEQRRVLESQLSAEQKRLDDLRVRYTDAYPDVETARENVADIEEKLASLKPAAHAATRTVSPQQPKADEGKAAHLRQERAQLVDAITIEKQREAMLRRKPVLAASPVPVMTPAGLLVYPSAEPVQQKPFKLMRLASDAVAARRASSLVWYGALTGILCGLAYFSFAAWRYGSTGAFAAEREDGTIHMENSWAEGIRNMIAQTDLGREEIPLPAAEGFAMNGDGHGKGEEQEPGSPVRSDEVPQAIRDGIEKDPKSWMAHTEEARIALAEGDFDTAIEEVKLAITVAPEKLKAQLNKIILQLDRNVDVGQIVLPMGLTMPLKDPEKRARNDNGSGRAVI